MAKVEQVDAVYTKYVMFPLDEAFDDLLAISSRTTLRVFLGIAREIEYNNLLSRGVQQKIADRAKLSVSEVHRAFDDLQKRGVIRKTRYGEYEVDAGFCWRGSFREFRKARDRQLNDDLQEMIDGLPRQTPQESGAETQGSAAAQECEADHDSLHTQALAA